MAANVSGAGGVDEPFADFSRGEASEVIVDAGNSHREAASNFSIQDKRQARSRVSGRGESRRGFVRKKFLCNRSLNDALKSSTEAQRDAANEKPETMIGDLDLEATL